MCGVATGSDSCPSYQERPTTKEKNDPSTVSVYILFSSYTYDALKSKSLCYAEPDPYNYNYRYYRFVSVVKWTKNGAVTESPNEVTRENVPASQQPTEATSPQCDKYIMIDCTSLREVPLDPSDPDGPKKSVPEVALSWENMTGFLSFAISEVKDYLFRIHKDGANGTVKFTISAYHPLDPLVMAFCHLIDSPVNNYKYDFSGFIDHVENVGWFKGFRDWLTQYSWKPELEDFAIIEGCDYGGTERTEFSIAKDRIDKINRAMAKMEPYIGELMMDTAVCDDEKMIEWKKLGGATTDETYKGKGFRPIYHFDNPRYSWDHDGKGIEETEWFGRDEQPLMFLTYSMFDVKILNGARWKLCRDKNSDPALLIPLDMIREIPQNKMQELLDDKEGGKDDIDDFDKPINEGIGDFYTINQLWLERKELIEIEDNDPMGPKWWISAGPDPSKNIRAGEAVPSTNQIDSGVWAQMMADEKKKQLAAMDENEINPKMSEYDEKASIIDQRDDTNSTEYEIWERRHVEDEAVSDQWNYEKNMIEYHGKLVNRQYFEDRATELLNKRNELIKQINKLEDYASLVAALKFLSAIQFALGFVSFGATSIGAAATLLVIDSLLEVTKMGFELYYNDNLTLGKAIENHMFSFVNNLISGFLLHSTFRKFTEPEITKINQLEPPKVNFATPGEYIGKQMGDFRMWLDNLTFATVSKEGAMVQALTKDASLAEKITLRTEGFFYHDLPQWDKFHLVASGAKAATFLYMANSMYENSLFVTNKQEMPINDMIRLELIPPSK